MHIVPELVKTVTIVLAIAVISTANAVPNEENALTSLGIRAVLTDKNGIPLRFLRNPDPHSRTGLNFSEARNTRPLQTPA